jgi:hypothetical protein
LIARRIERGSFHDNEKAILSFLHRWRVRYRFRRSNLAEFDKINSHLAQHFHDRGGRPVDLVGGAE